jgi:hypothetical protein
MTSLATHNTLTARGITTAYDCSRKSKGEYLRQVTLTGLTWLLNFLYAHQSIRLPPRKPLTKISDVFRTSLAEYNPTDSRPLFAVPVLIPEYGRDVFALHLGLGGSPARLHMVIDCNTECRCLGDPLPLPKDFAPGACLVLDDAQRAKLEAGTRLQVCIPGANPWLIASIA